MFSLRFHFAIPGIPRKPPPRLPHLLKSSSSPFSPTLMAATSSALAGAAATIAGAAAAGFGATLAVSPNSSNSTGESLFEDRRDCSAPLWASVSLAESSTTEVEPKTGVLFPSVVDGNRWLLGIGLRKKSVFGLKNIDVYAFGVYANDSDLGQLRAKYGVLSESELKESKEFITDVLDQDVKMTVRLQIVYGRLSIASVRSAFEESVRNRFKKFCGSENKELLQRFTSLFRDEFKLPRGSVIDLSKEQGYVLQIKIDGEEVGSIQSKLLCQSILDLYIGDDPFDNKAKKAIQLRLISLLQN